jgi:hypothetical protein
MFLKECRISQACVCVCVCVCVRAIVDHNMFPKSSNRTESCLRETCTFKETQRSLYYIYSITFHEYYKFTLVAKSYCDTW